LENKMQEVWFGDCLDLMKNISTQSVDMILCDLPYGTTACSWDCIIPFEDLWLNYNRIIKENGTVVLTGSQPFTSKLICSNIEDFKYEIIWIKHQATNPMFSKKGILKAHENICVFYRKQPTYNPQIEYDKPYGGFKSRLGKKIGEAYGEILDSQHRDNPDGERYPVSFVYFANVNKDKMHPTQKPVELMEYLIKTYTNEGDLILDNCAGSGSTLVAAKNLNRQFIGIEKEQKYYDIIINRLKNTNKFVSMFETEY